MAVDGTWRCTHGSGGLSVTVTDMAWLIASLSLRSGNPAVDARTTDNWITNAVLATSTLYTPPSGVLHGFHGWDWVAATEAAHHIFNGAKGGTLPGTGT